MRLHSIHGFLANEQRTILYSLPDAFQSQLKEYLAKLAGLFGFWVNDREACQLEISNKLIISPLPLLKCQIDKGIGRFGKIAGKLAGHKY